MEFDPQTKAFILDDHDRIRLRINETSVPIQLAGKLIDAAFEVRQQALRVRDKARENPNERQRLLMQHAIAAQFGYARHIFDVLAAHVELDESDYEQFTQLANGEFNV